MLSTIVHNLTYFFTLPFVLQLVNHGLLIMNTTEQAK